MLKMRLEGEELRAEVFQSLDSIVENGGGEEFDTVARGPVGSVYGADPRVVADDLYDCGMDLNVDDASDLVPHVVEWQARERERFGR